MNRLLRAHLLCVAASAVCVCVCTVAQLQAEEDAGTLVASAEPGWPQWRGPRRDGVSDEKGLMQSWPAGGPKLLWKASGIGKGWASPVISADTIYITGDENEELHVFALDPDGKQRWRATNAAAWTGSYPGSRSCGAVCQRLFYHINAHGRVACFDTESGKEIWAVDAWKTFGAAKTHWGSAESPLIDRDRVVVTPVGTKALMVALDRKTGKVVWATPPLADETADYPSPILAEVGGRRAIFTTTSKHAIAVDADTGKMLWKYRHLILKPPMVTTMPVFARGALFVTNSSPKGANFYRLNLTQDNGAVEQIWDAGLGTPHCTAICVGTDLYCGSKGRVKGWQCVDTETGRFKYAAEDVEIGAQVFADGCLYCVSSNGSVSLLKPGDGGFERRGHFDLVQEKKDFWANPVICDAKLYLRYDDTLYCYDIQAK
ncbi:MAG: PQQ-binding-like beta-propeller repeat protein [Candidatus Nealsonbacteria bacterium]|nr:PQQ-binding-like beta-propeller repeat protein [Candidatus Nealsonbacteria bacterium]